MKKSQSHLFNFASMLIFINIVSALDCDSKQIKTITVANSGKADFTSIQKAVNSVPDQNTQWIRIQIAAGVYAEKIIIPVGKPCIFLQGAGKDLTTIALDDHEEKLESPIFTSFATNIVGHGLSFKNTFNLEPGKPKKPSKQAQAARIVGNQSAFFECGFYGIQDTLFDDKGNHYFKDCYIEGGIDFIYGSGKSIYEKCTVSLNIETLYPGLAGHITAQKKESPDQQSGFVFKECVFTGKGKANFGRAWGPYSTVIIANSRIDDVITPQGWEAWHFVGHEGNFTYIEAHNSGAGADTSHRVRWMKNLADPQLNRYTDISFINENGWLSKIPNIFQSHNAHFDLTSRPIDSDSADMEDDENLTSRPVELDSTDKEDDENLTSQPIDMDSTDKVEDDGWTSFFNFATFKHALD